MADRTKSKQGKGKRKRQSPLKGIVYGALAGALASAGMDLYWGAAENAIGARPEQKPKKGGIGQIKPEPSTQVIADKVSQAVAGHSVPRRHKAAAGVGVHYATGVLCGAIYGAIETGRPGLGIFADMLFGASIWLGLDEVGLRALDLGPNAGDVPLSQHAEALGAHLVFGSITGLVSRLLLRAL